MKGLFVLLAIVAVASARAPAVEDKGIIDDILAIKECIEDALAAIQNDVNAIINIVKGLQDTIETALANLRECPNLGDPISIANCIVSVGNGLKDEVINTIAIIQNIVANLSDLPNTILACFRP